VTAIASSVPVRGIDVSRHQGTVDFAQVRAAGYQFAILKLTDGTAYSYAFWGRDNIPRAKAAGLIVGAYHWLDAGPTGVPKDPAGQARYFVDQAKAAGGFKDLIAVVDVEVERDGDGRIISLPKVDSVRAFAAEFRRLVPGKTLLIYTGRWYWRDMIGNPVGADIGPLWHSEYEPSIAEVTDGPEMAVYGGWTRALMWQFTSNDRGLGMDVPGVAGNCDVNQFFGTRADLLALAGSTFTSEEDDFMAALTEAEQRRILTTCDVLWQALDFPDQMDNWSGNLPGRVDWIYKNLPLLMAALGAKIDAINSGTVDGDDLDEAEVVRLLLEQFPVAAIAQQVVARIDPNEFARLVVDGVGPEVAGEVLEALRSALAA
jgi:lysozyme